MPNQSTPEIDALRSESDIAIEFARVEPTEDVVPLSVAIQAVRDTETRVREETAREIVEALREYARPDAGTLIRPWADDAADFISRTFLNGEGSE